MPKNLVIVESPAKAKTIEKFLGNDYKVMSSYGHIRDLNKKKFGIDIDMVLRLSMRYPTIRSSWLMTFARLSRLPTSYGWHLMRTARVRL